MQTRYGTHLSGGPTQFTPPPDKIGGALYCFCLRAPITLVTPLICVFFGMYIYRTKYDWDAFILSSNSAIAITVYRPLFRTAWVRRYQKGKTSLDLNEARGDGVLGWQWHQVSETA